MADQLPVDNVALFREFLGLSSSGKDDAARAIAERMTDQFRELALIHLMQNKDPVAAKQALLAFDTDIRYLLGWKYYMLGTLSILFSSMAEADAYFAHSIELTDIPGIKSWVCVNWAGGIVERNTENDPAEAERAMKIVQQGLPWAHGSTMTTLKAILGVCYKILGRYAEAIEIFESINGDLGNPLSNAMANSDLGDLYRLNGDNEQALFYTRRAWSAVASAEALAFDKVNILDKLIEAERDAGNLDQALAFAQTAIELTESSRAVIIEQRDRIAYFGLLRSCYEVAISCLLKTGDYATAFDYTERSRAREMSGTEPVTFSTLSLPDDLAIVSYYIVKGRLWAFVLGQGSIEAVDLCAVEEVKTAFDNTGYPRNLLPGAKGKLRNAFVLDRLADLVARPLEPLVAQYDRLCLLPYGPLHHMPITMMFQNGHAFVTPSVTILKNSKPRHSRFEVVAIGYNGETLNHAEAEAQSVGDRVYVGAEATKAAILNNAMKARCLHISAHGFFDRKDPERSYLQLVDGPLYAGEISAHLRLDSALVVLSSCDSGRSQIQPGEESFGLIRSFITAGARTVVCSLWPVDEVATRLLMEHFYKNIRAGMRTAHAIRRAQDTVRALPKSALREQLAMPGIPKGASTKITAKSDDLLPFSHPYWWAGFVVVGDEFTQ